MRYLNEFKISRLVDKLVAIATVKRHNKEILNLGDNPKDTANLYP